MKHGDRLMTDLRARLVEALPPAYVHMTEEQIVDVLMEVPGIAIVELPEANSSGRWSISAKNDLYVEDGEVVQHLPKSSGMTFTTRSPTVVRQIAATLLAAANAAEDLI